LLHDIGDSIGEYMGGRAEFNNLMRDLSNVLIDHSVLQSNADSRTRIFFGEVNRRKKYGLPPYN